MLDRNSAERSFEVGDRVMVRIPGQSVQHCPGHDAFQGNCIRPTTK